VLTRQFLPFLTSNLRSLQQFGTQVSLKLEMPGFLSKVSDHYEVPISISISISSPSSFALINDGFQRLSYCHFHRFILQLSIFESLHDVSQCDRIFSDVYFVHFESNDIRSFFPSKNRDNRLFGGYSFSRFPYFYTSAGVEENDLSEGLFRL
jgi:hypothetical protein